MSTPAGDDREQREVEALRTDRYLEALLAAADRHATDVPADSALDPAVRDAATRLAHELVRVHPSFRFEERLAARLARAAEAMQLASVAGGESLSVPLLRVGADERDFDPLAHPLGEEADAPDADDRTFRPLLIGGALTSAAISLAGAAFLAWRRTQAPARRGSPMARAVRAARGARVAGRRSARTPGPAALIRRIG